MFCTLSFKILADVMEFIRDNCATNHDFARIEKWIFLLDERVIIFKLLFLTL